MADQNQQIQQATPPTGQTLPEICDRLSQLIQDKHKALNGEAPATSGTAHADYRLIWDHAQWQQCATKTDEIMQALFARIEEMNAGLHESLVMSGRRVHEFHDMYSGAQGTYDHEVKRIVGDKIEAENAKPFWPENRANPALWWYEHGKKPERPAYTFQLESPTPVSTSKFKLLSRSKAPAAAATTGPSQWTHAEDPELMKQMRTHDLNHRVVRQNVALWGFRKTHAMEITKGLAKRAERCNIVYSNEMQVIVASLGRTTPGVMAFLDHCLKIADHCQLIYHQYKKAQGILNDLLRSIMEDDAKESITWSHQNFLSIHDRLVEAITLCHGYEGIASLLQWRKSTDLLINAGKANNGFRTIEHYITEVYTIRASMLQSKVNLSAAESEKQAKFDRRWNMSWQAISSILSLGASAKGLAV